MRSDIVSASGLVVGDVDHGDAEALVQLPDLELHLLAQLLVERAQRLVHQDQLRLEHQRAGDRDALLLAAGSCAGRRAPKPDELHHVQRALDPRSAMSAAGTPRTDSGKPMLSATVMCGNSA